MSIHDDYAEQVIAARDHDLAESHRLIRELLWLLRASGIRADDLERKARELGICD